MAGHCLAPASCLSCLAQAFRGHETPQHLPPSSRDFAVSQGWAAVGEMVLPARQP